MNDKLVNLEGVALENALWVKGMNLHNETDVAQYEYLDFIHANSRRLGPKLYYRCLTNILHVFYANMNDENRQKYIDMMLSIHSQSIGGFGVGEVIEVLGIIVKRCNAVQIDQIFSYVEANVPLCRTDASALVSICNCFRYMYPEVQANMQKKILSILTDLIARNSIPELAQTLRFTLHSLREVFV